VKSVLGTLDTSPMTLTLQQAYFLYTIHSHNYFSI